MEGHFSFGFSDSVESLLYSLVLVEDWFIAVVYSFLQVGEVEFELG